MIRLLLILLFLTSESFAGPLQVATTTEDLAYLVSEIGQNKVQVFAIAKGTQDPHQIEAKPTMMTKLSQVDLVITHGLELEESWIKPLIEGSRNLKIQQSANGYLELGPKLDPLEKLTGNVSRSEGDIHPDGNPHFQLDPIRMARAAVLIANRMAELDPPSAQDYRKSAAKISARLEGKTKDWTSRIRKSGQTEFVSYHKTFSYFASRFALKNGLQLEPKPGIPPSLSHTLDVIRQIKERKVKLVLIENYFADSVKDRLMQDLPQLIVKTVPVQVGGGADIKSTEDLIEYIIRLFEEAGR